ncbi:MAG: hypothetical protein QOJ69_1019 [Actinomycetota bacterium]|jgi:hypothetical protein|nr:hypothetical protein [Actinomycetota bacterium]
MGPDDDTCAYRPIPRTSCLRCRITPGDARAGCARHIGTGYGPLRGQTPMIRNWMMAAVKIATSTRANAIEVPLRTAPP